MGSVGLVINRLFVSVNEFIKTDVAGSLACLLY